MKLEHLLSAYHSDARTGHTMTKRAEITAINSESTWNVFLRHFPITNLQELNEPVLRKFFRYGELDRKWSNMTTVTYRKNMSAFIYWCIRKGYMHNNPLKMIPKPRVEYKLPKYYSEEQIESIMRALDYVAATDFERKRNKAMFHVLALAGLRRGELLSLKLSDIDLDGNLLKVQAETSKARQDRIIPISLTLKESLKRYLEVRQLIAQINCNDLWVALVSRRQFTQHGLKHLVARLSKAVDFNVRPHSFRHSCATYAYAETQDIAAVQKMLGHRDISTTMIYTNVLPETVRKTVEMNRLNRLCAV